MGHELPQSPPTPTGLLTGVLVNENVRAGVGLCLPLAAFQARRKGAQQCLFRALRLVVLYVWRGSISFFIFFFPKNVEHERKENENES